MAEQTSPLIDLDALIAKAQAEAATERVDMAGDLMVAHASTQLALAVAVKAAQAYMAISNRTQPREVAALRAALAPFTADPKPNE